MTETDALPDIPPEYGTFYNRMVATMIDLAVLFMIALPVVEYLMGHIFPPLNISRAVAILNAPPVAHNPPKLIAAFMQLAREQQAIQRVLVENLLEILCIALYTLPFWFRFSATPGKMLFRLEIRDATTGARMTRRQSVIRFLGYIVSTLPMSLGFIWVGINKKRRGFHDLIAGTVVVVKPRSRSE